MVYEITDWNGIRSDKGTISTVSPWANDYLDNPTYQMKIDHSAKISVLSFAIISLNLFVPLSGCAHFGPKVSGDPKTEEFPASGIETLVIHSQAGDVKVVGIDDADGIIRVTTTASAANASELAQIRLQHDQSASMLTLKSDIPEKHDASELNISVIVPAGTMIEVDDGSGNIRIENVGSTKIKDGSGKISVSKVVGDLHIKDGSGAIELSEISDSLSIDDGSGDIRIQGSGRTEIKDGSGDITASTINGDLQIKDGSGDTYVTEVRGNADLKDGSGDITIEKVSGSLSIKDGSGGIRVQDAGATSIKDGSGSITVKNIVGEVDIKDGSGGIDLDRIDGNVNIADGSGSFTHSGVTGNVIYLD